MNVSCSRTELREALRVVGGVVDPRNIKPILKDIHLRVVGDMLELSATDLEVGIKYFVRDVEVKSAGGIVVPVDPLVGIVNESPDERLTLQVKELGMIVQGKGSRFQVMGLSEDEFPAIPDFPEGNALEVEAAILKEMIEKCVFAVSLEKQRYALNGVLLVTKEKAAKIEMVGTDGHRLAVIRRKANSPAPFAASAIISVKALQEVLKMISGEEIIKLLISERQALIRSERGVLVAQLVDGRFPPYKEVIPDDCDKKLEIEAEELSDAIRQASVLTMSGSRTVWLKFAPGSLTIESNDPELGEAHVTIDVKYEGAPIEMRFSPEFLLDGLKAIGKERIRLEMKDPARPAVMRVGPDYVYLIMPIVQD
jgi:DNA polymerase-3 subunit beta